MRTGQCKFGESCRFHHPLLQQDSCPLPSPSPFSLSAAPLLRSGSPAYDGQALMQPSVLALPPGWAYHQVAHGPGHDDLHHVIQPQPHPLFPQQRQQLLLPQAAYMQQLGLMPMQAYTDLYGAVAPGLAMHPGFAIYPERPGQSECQHYMMTGDCKFGLSCKYHHPRNRIVPSPTCSLSPMGLPLRPGGTACAFYERYGICKFGPTCKFDHPMRQLAYSPSSSSLAETPVAPLPAPLDEEACDKTETAAEEGGHTAAP
eukprot:SM000004S15020  [mRNA]  locus=s4:868869:869935:+ [translate_table: standard]